MIRATALAALLALSACTATSGQLTDQQACERQANEDPVVKDMLLKAAGSPHYLLDEQDEIRAARQAATLRCLRARGVIRPGGVERQKPL